MQRVSGVGAGDSNQQHPASPSHNTPLPRFCCLQAKEDEPDFYVSVPGMKRQQTLSRSISGISSLGGGATPAAPAAAAEAPSPAAPQPRPPSRVGSLERHPTLGSGTVVHGFKGLFRNIIVAGSTSNAGC